jgi:hypothetical protein
LDLAREYRRLNRKHFGGRLPADVDVSFSERMPMGNAETTHPHGILACDPLFCPEDCAASFIRIDPYIREWDAFVLGSLLHGMVHIKSLIVKDRRTARGLAAHGPIFQREMKRLARADAFRDIW